MLSRQPQLTLGSRLTFFSKGMRLSGLLARAICLSDAAPPVQTGGRVRPRSATSQSAAPFLAPDSMEMASTCAGLEMSSGFFSAISRPIAAATSLSAAGGAAYGTDRACTTCACVARVSTGRKHGQIGHGIRGVCLRAWRPLRESWPPPPHVPASRAAARPGPRGYCSCPHA
jgi:hypothetical protein